MERKLFRRLSTGEPLGPWTTEFGYPFRWHYDVLNAASYFRDAGRPDERLAEAIALIRAARQPDGTWLQQRTDSGRVWFAVDVPAGQPSKWLTLFATRVLNWWDAR